MSEVIVVVGAGSIGQAIARRVSAGKQVVLADLHGGDADAAAEVMQDAAFDVSRARRHRGRSRNCGRPTHGPNVITGSDFLVDGGVTASYFYGELAPTAA